MRTAIRAAAQRTGNGSGVSALKQARVFLCVSESVGQGTAILRRIGTVAPDGKMHPTARRENKKPARDACFSRVFEASWNHTEAMLVPGTGLEPASQLRRRIFVTLLLSKPASSKRRRSCAGLCLHRRARAWSPPMRLRRPPSSLYTFLAAISPRGLARRCLDARIRGFAEFEGFCTDRFRPGTQSFKSAMFTNFITPAKGRDAILPLLRACVP